MTKFINLNPPKTTDLKPGDRVRVRSLDLNHWSRPAAEAMSGATGVVTETKRPHSEGALLVTFDAPVEPWWTNQLPQKAFWFDPDELHRLAQAPAHVQAAVAERSASETEGGAL